MTIYADKRSWSTREMLFTLFFLKSRITVGTNESDHKVENIMLYLLLLKSYNNKMNQLEYLPPTKIKKNIEFY